MRIRRALIVGGIISLLPLSGGCSANAQHNGRLPFSLVERAPKCEGKPLRIIVRNEEPGTSAEAFAIAKIRQGDVIAFQMSHAEAWSHLRRGGIQKLPYDVLRYGHMALVVPDPQQAQVSSDLRLLQLAMKQAANADSTTDYLKGKHWVVFRAEDDLDRVKLHEFSRRVLVTAGDPKNAYDYGAVFGIRNKPYAPKSVSEIGDKFTCVTLVVAGLHYSGCPLNAVHRNGWFDIVTPRQVVESRVP